MARIIDRVAAFARSPKGRRVVEQVSARAQQLAKDPATRARLERARAEVTKRVNGRRKPR